MDLNPSSSTHTQTARQSTQRHSWGQALLASVGTLLMALSLPSFAIAPVSPVMSAASESRAEARAVARAKAEAKAEVAALVQAYSAKSDSELTQLSSSWQELDRLERQVLLREVKLRMARQKGRQGVLRIRTERRFGRVVRQQDGSVVRLETRVVQIRKAPASQSAAAAQSRPPTHPPKRAIRSASARVKAPGSVRRQYGTGFDQRQKALVVKPALVPAKP